MALADNQDQFRAMAEVFEDLRQQVSKLEQEIASVSRQPDKSYDASAEVAAAMAVLDRLPELAADSGQLAKIGEAFQLINVRLFLKFKKVQVKKRTLNKLAHGVVTFGEAPPPVPLYAGPTGRRAKIANNAASVAAGSVGNSTLPDRLVSGREGKSLGNVSRGDRI